MENKKQILLIAIAVGVGLMAVYFTSTVITGTVQRQAEQLKEDYEVKQKENMAALQQQSEQKMAALAQQIDRVKAEQQETMQKEIAELKTKLQDQQQRVAVPVKKIKPSLAVKTPSGKRAITVMVDSLSAVGGLLNPGDFVDIIAQLKVPAGGEAAKDKNSVTAMIFQGLEVLAVNTNLEEVGAYYDEQQVNPALKVTVAVDPQEAGLLTFADKNGDIQMALRSPQDSEHQMVKASTWKTLADYVLQNQGADINLPDELKGEIVDNAEATPTAKPTIQIFRGGKEL